MNVIRTIEEITVRIDELKRAKKSIGLVPTMGFLHEGHLKLVKQSREDNDVTIVSIFVNPLQFNNTSDLTSYPSDINRDLELLTSLFVDVVFMPSIEEMYRQKPVVSIAFGALGTKLEGKYRPGHFDGVGVIVSKLFHLTLPDKAYFGLKDLQQFMLIKKMVTDLSFPVTLVPIPTEREENGLAMSSRNARLSTEGKTHAGSLYQGLLTAQKKIENKTPLSTVQTELVSFYENIKDIELEYAAIINPHTFNEVETYSPSKDVAICVAAYIEGVRLIDNLYLQPESNK